MRGARHLGSRCGGAAAARGCGLPAGGRLLGAIVAGARGACPAHQQQNGELEESVMIADSASARVERGFMAAV
eukprot:1851194-Lingulodinium_polyedra.AAC.1